MDHLVFGTVFSTTVYRSNELTPIVVNLVVAVDFHLDGAVLALPAVFAVARPLSILVPAEAAAASDAATVAGALAGAALEGAVEAVPAGHAEAGAVLALLIETQNCILLSKINLSKGWVK